MLVRPPFVDDHITLSTRDSKNETLDRIIVASILYANFINVDNNKISLDNLMETTNDDALQSSRNGLIMPTWRSKLVSWTNPQHDIPGSSISCTLESSIVSMCRRPSTVVTTVLCFFSFVFENPWISCASECIASVKWVFVSTNTESR